MLKLTPVKLRSCISLKINWWS